MENALSTTVGAYYNSAGTINGFRHVRGGILDRLIGPDAWYKAEFRDPRSGISSTIWEYRNRLAFDNYLGSISIQENGLLVYKAQVSCYDVADHEEQRYDNRLEWLDAVVELAQRYTPARTSR